MVRAVVGPGTPVVPEDHLPCVPGAWARGLPREGVPEPRLRGQTAMDRVRTPPGRGRGRRRPGRRGGDGAPQRRWHVFDDPSITDAASELYGTAEVGPPGRGQYGDRGMLRCRGPHGQPAPGSRRPRAGRGRRSDGALRGGQPPARAARRQRSAIRRPSGRTAPADRRLGPATGRGARRGRGRNRQEQTRPGGTGRARYRRPTAAGRPVPSVPGGPHPGPGRRCRP